MNSSKKKLFRILSKKTVFRGHLSQLDVLQIQTQNGRRVERELIRHRGAVILIPILPDGRLILIRQLRIATGGAIWEFPAGTLEKGEPIRKCASRELLEETGWKAGRLRKLFAFYPTPGISTEKMHLFLADRLTNTGKTSLDVDEELEVSYFSSREVERMVHRRKIIDGKTLLGFLYYRLYLRS